MVDNRGVDTDPGWINRKFRELDRSISDLRSERRARSTTVSSGDFTVENGGNVRVKGGGTVTVEGGVLRSVFIFLSSALQPGGMRVTNASGSPYVADFGSLGGTEIGIDSPNLPVRLKTALSDVRIDHTTTSNSANAFIDSTTGRVSRSTSSRRYKQDIEDHTLDAAAVLNLRPRTWRDRLEIENDPECERRYIGFIAEEVHDLGLTEFVEYDEEGQPDAIAYDRLAVALLLALQDQQTRLAQLETTSGEHTTTIGKITAALRPLLPKGTL